MTLAEARALDEQGKLIRKVLTEEGWYIPKYTPATAPGYVPPRPTIKLRKTKES